MKKSFRKTILPYSKKKVKSIINNKLQMMNCCLKHTHTFQKKKTFKLSTKKFNNLYDDQTGNKLVHSKEKFDKLVRIIFFFY